MSGHRPGARSFAIVITVVIVLLTLSIAPTFMLRNVRSTSPQSSSEPIPNIVASFPVVLLNNQSIPTSNPYDQMIVLNNSAYVKYESATLGNVFWLTSGRALIPSWIEGNNNSSSDNTVFWLKIPFGLLANSSAVIFLDFTNKSVNLLNANGYEGAYPTFTHVYGQYDNGAMVFPAYWDFQGRNSPDGITNLSNGIATVYFDNGAIIYSPTGYQHAGIITTQEYPSSYVWMVNILSFDLITGNPEAYPISISNSNAFSNQYNQHVFPGGFPESVACNNFGSRYFITKSNQGSIMNWGSNMEYTSTYALGWFNNRVTGYTNDMQNAGSLSYYNISEHSKVYFSSYIDTGLTDAALMKEIWVAGVYGLPNGAMPEYTVSPSML